MATAAQYDDEAAPMLPQGDVRMHVAGTVLSNGVGPRTRSEHNFRLAALVLTFLNAPQAVAGTFVFLFWSTGKPCDRPLAVWIAFSLLRLVLEVCVGWSLYFHVQGRFIDHPVMKFFLSVRNPLELMSRIFYIMGSLWFVFRDSNCGSADGPSYYLALSLLACQTLIMLAPCILILCLLPVAFCCLPLFLRLARRLQGQPPGRGATESQLQDLPTERYAAPADGDADAQTNCAICLTEYEVGDELRVLPCDGHHKFHKACVDEWLVLNATCPACRQRVAGETPSSGGAGGGGAGPAPSSTAAPAASHGDPAAPAPAVPGPSMV